MKIIACVMFAFGVVIWLVLPSRAGGPDSALDDVLNATYTIEKQEVRLIDGRAEVEAAPGSATKIITTVFHKPVFDDLNDDGRDDAALFLKHDPGGSGTFYYVACALAQNDHYQGTNAVLLGDRVAPRSIRIRNGVIIANYDDRRKEEPMAVPPTIVKTLYLKLKRDRLEAIEPPDTKRR